VPSGFVTDFASIPRAFWSALRPDGDYAYAAIIHDYLYWTQPVPRATADDILRFAMQDLSVESTTVTLIYRAVRTGVGGRVGTTTPGSKPRAEKRVLKRLPETPTVRWADWKKMPDVFSDSRARSAPCAGNDRWPFSLVVLGIVVTPAGHVRAQKPCSEFHRRF